MRIGESAQRPLPGPFPANGLSAGLSLAAGTADRALQQQVAAIAAATPWSVLDGLSTEPGTSPGNTPPALPPGTPTLSLATAAGATVMTPSLGDQPSLQTSAATALSGLLAASVAGDRLSLTPATVALGHVPADTGKPPIVEFALNLLAGLTGEPRSRVLLLSPDAAAATDIGPGPAARGSADPLQLLIRGSLHGADGRLIDLTIGLSAQRQAGAPVIDRAVLALIQASLEELARSEIKLDYPGTAATLAGHSSRFQAMVDPLALWPMQSFLLSGLLVFGAARDADAADEIDEETTDDPEPDAREPDSQAEERPAPSRTPDKAGAALATEPAPLPADGGLPIISASHWLELELRHWRTQLRLWMALPAQAPLG